MMLNEQRKQPVAIYAVTSGKGGVGKTNVVLNLAIALAETGGKVLILDADLGLGNLDVLLGMQSRYSMGDVLAKSCTLQEAILEGPAGIKILPAESGIQELTQLETGEKMLVFSLFQELLREANTILIDTASGISSNVSFFSSFAHHVLLVATPEPTSITDAYATMKVLFQTNGERDFQLIINRAESEQQGWEVYETLRRAAEHFLEIRPEYVGSISRDSHVERAVRLQKPVMLLHPDARVSQDFRTITKRLGNQEPRRQANTPRDASRTTQAIYREVQ
jgi:flagellar biosynthesis protein FlhG